MAKKNEDLDYTNQPQAKTAADVDAQDARTRLYQSLAYSYGKQQEQSDKAYDKAISQSMNAAQARGLGRSSYNIQTQANLQQDKVDARNDIGAALIADYQNRIGDIENQEKEDERWERQFAETQKQNEWQRQYQESESARTQANWEKEYAANRSDTQWSQNYQQQQFQYQQARDTIADAQWQKQYDEQLRQFNENMAYQRERANVSDAQWQKTYDENLREFNAQMAQQESQFKQNLAFQQSEAARQQSNWQQEYNANRADTAWTQAFQQQQANLSQANWEKEYAANQEQNAWSREFQESEAARNQRNLEIQQAFNEKQWNAQQEQWKQEFEYSKMTNQQKIAYETLVNIIAQGNDPSDALLKQAGISRADANAMKAQAKASGSSTGSGNPWDKLGITKDQYNEMKKAGYSDWNKYQSDKNKKTAEELAQTLKEIEGAKKKSAQAYASRNDASSKVTTGGSTSYKSTK